jgi:ribosomal subunit interface protein
MHLLVESSNIEVNQRIKSLINEKVELKLSRLLSRFHQENLNAILHIQKLKYDQYKLSLSIDIPGKKDIYASTKHIDLTSGLVDLTAEAEKQIEKIKQNLL